MFPSPLQRIIVVVFPQTLLALKKKPAARVEPV
jgi:hypothetical protein